MKRLLLPMNAKGVNNESRDGDDEILEGRESQSRGAKMEIDQDDPQRRKPKDNIGEVNNDAKIV